MNRIYRIPKPAAFQLPSTPTGFILLILLILSSDKGVEQLLSNQGEDRIYRIPIPSGVPVTNPDSGWAGADSPTALR
jgi:hypothetical protein